VPVILPNWVATLLFLIGLSVAPLLEARAAGALVFSPGVAIMGIGTLVRDRAVGIALILMGAAAIVGVVEHNVTGVGL
jgi:hypothetical protein